MIEIDQLVGTGWWTCWFVLFWSAPKNVIIIFFRMWKKTYFGRGVVSVSWDAIYGNMWDMCLFKYFNVRNWEINLNLGLEFKVHDSTYLAVIICVSILVLSMSLLGCKLVGQLKDLTVFNWRQSWQVNLRGKVVLFRTPSSTYQCTAMSTTVDSLWIEEWAAKLRKMWSIKVNRK